jgi:hypothetical protein
VAAQAKWARDAGVLPDRIDDSDQFDSSNNNQTSRPGTAMSSQSQSLPPVQSRTVSREATVGTAAAETRGAKVHIFYKDASDGCVQQSEHCE